MCKLFNQILSMPSYPLSYSCTVFQIKKKKHKTPKQKQSTLLFTLNVQTGTFYIALLVSVSYPHENFTCVCCLRMKHDVCIGDKLQLFVQSREKRTRQDHVFLSRSLDGHHVHLSSNIKNSKCCSQRYLLRD